MKTALREGFTTGSAATGAALAALCLLREGSAPTEVEVPLPPFAPAPRPGRPAAACPETPGPEALVPAAPGPETSGDAQPHGWRTLPVAACGAGPAPELAALPLPPGRAAHAVVLKDGGDDPDATNGARITVTIIIEEATRMAAEQNAPAAAAAASGSGAPGDAQAFPPIRIDGGPGVGRVTLPGLPVPVGAAAINPVPRQQMEWALRHALSTRPGPRRPLTALVSVPEGAALAARTFNPRLGIVGGISILGTQGTVRPFSHAAWKATIAQGLEVALATGCPAVALSTGRRSERLLMARYPRLPPQAFVQAADFAAFSLKAAGALPGVDIIWGCFFGKLLKLAQGHAYTHARNADLDLTALAALCREHGATCAPAVARCTTAAQALELLLSEAAGPAVLRAATTKAAAVAAAFAGRPVRLHLLHTDGRELACL